jgi:hypothetical protein
MDALVGGVGVSKKNQRNKDNQRDKANPDRFTHIHIQVSPSLAMGNNLIFSRWQSSNILRIKFNPSRRIFENANPAAHSRIG